MVTSPARAAAGTASAMRGEEWDDASHDAAAVRTVPDIALRRQGRRPSTEYNPYTGEKRRFCSHFSPRRSSCGGALAAGADQPRVLAIHFDNDVNPVTADYLTSEIDRANDKGYDAVVIVMDTPGGLSDSMRKVYQRELSSKIPVIVYVAPDGARAASAGVWIGEAADVLAMAPQTNIGSSTPISVGGEDIQKDLRRKVVNDAAASLRALAKSHGRNVKWADAAVRKASNLTAERGAEGERDRRGRARRCPRC